jgi:beta-xylosidase
MTEWNSTISHRDLLNDTVFKSAYITKNILENYDQLDSFGYWVLSDFIEEVKMSDQLFHGGLGLFTYNGIKKSGYFAYVLLKKLGDRLLSKGEGYFVTRSTDGFQIIVYNYQHFSKIYAAGELFDMTFTNRYTPFPDSSRLKIVIPFTDLPNSGYTMTETILNRQHGSAFDKWLELGALPLETQYDVNYLKSVSVPYIKKRRLSVENNLLYVSCELEPHEVRLIELKANYQNNDLSFDF